LTTFPRVVVQLGEARVPFPRIRDVDADCLFYQAVVIDSGLACSEQGIGRLRTESALRLGVGREHGEYRGGEDEYQATGHAARRRVFSTLSICFHGRPHAPGGVAHFMEMTSPCPAADVHGGP